MALSNITVCLKKMTSSFVPSQCSFLCASCGLQNPFYRVALTELSMKGFSFLCSVLCMLVQKKNFHSQKVSEYKQLLFSIYHIIKTKRQKWVQVALSLWSYWYSFPPPHQQLKMVHHVQEPLSYYWSWDTSYYFSLVGARWHSFFHLWGNIRWQWGRWPISSPCCFADHSLPAACMTLHVSPLILSDAKLHRSLGKYHCPWQVMQETVMQRSCQGGGLV